VAGTGLFLPKSGGGVADVVPEEWCVVGLFGRTLALCCSIRVSSAAEEAAGELVAGGAPVLCGALGGARRTGGTGLFVFWASAKLAEIRTTATAAANLIMPSIPLDSIPGSKFSSTRLC
jgi:hypothetical protein